MRYIFAAFAIQYQKNLYPLTKDVLETYVNHRTPKSKFAEQLKSVKEIGGTMFMDSGAFSAWTKKEVINIDEYASFCLRFQDDLECIASLDVIPGKFGCVPTKAEVDQSAEKGFENYLYLLEKGLDPNKLMHIFHQGEDFFWLEEIIKVCPYFGISPANDRTTEQKIQWLEQCMRVACDENGMPRGKWHGFGVTSWDIMYRYPWFSCDSSTWLRPGSYGYIYVPMFTHGECDYSKPPRIVAVSEKSSSLGEEGKHISTLTENEREVVLTLIKEDGFSLEELSKHYYVRHQFNIGMIRRLIAGIPPYPWAYKTAQPSFL